MKHENVRVYLMLLADRPESRVNYLRLIVTCAAHARALAVARNAAAGAVSPAGN
jgi:hypothetical protein